MTSLKARPGFFRRQLRLLERVFAVFGVLAVVYLVGFDLSVIHSNSMAPTLMGTPDTQQDVILAEKISYWFRDPRRWEIVKYHTPDEIGTQVMKRVVALPGETVAIGEDKRLIIDGKPLAYPQELDFLEYFKFGNLHNGKTVDCEDRYFCMGDDNHDSYDSRFTGPITKQEVEARAWLCIWPPSRIRFLTP